MYPSVVDVRHVKDYRLCITFADGKSGEIDFRDDIVGQGGVFKPLEDVAFFKQVSVVAGGTIGWPNDVDFAPEVLYHDITGAPLPGSPEFERVHNGIAWADFALEAPSLAAFGHERLAGRVAYLATVREDGAPRLHPVTPVLGAANLYLFMEPTSPKGHDLRYGSGYALHCGVEDNSGGGGEFLLTGSASLVDDTDERAEAAAAAGYAPAERYILFRLLVREVIATTYQDGNLARQRWRSGG